MSLTIGIVPLKLFKRTLFPALIFLGLFIGCRNELPIRYVDNGRFFRDVKVFVVVRDSVQAANKAWQAAAKPLKDSVDAYMKKMSALSGPVSNAERGKLEQEFQRRQEQFQQFAAANQKKTATLEKDMTEAAIKKVNLILQEYRDQKGYALILGTTGGGNILAADKHLEITDEVISFVNAAKP